MITMIEMILVMLAISALPASFPWIVKKIFGAKVGLSFGVIETIVLAGVLAYLNYEFRAAALANCDPSSVRFEGNTAIDNDGYCRGLFFVVPALIVLAATCLCVQIVSLAVMFWSSYKQIKKGA
jgi:hypothetical protein